MCYMCFFCLGILPAVALAKEGAKPLMRPRRPAYFTQSLQIRSAPTRLSVTLPRLCFQSLPTIKFCNSFPLITIQLYRGCTPLAPQPPRISRVPYVLPSSVCSKSFVSHSYENCRGVYSSHSGTNLGTPHRPQARAERSFELSTVNCQLLARAPRCGRYLSSHCSRHRTVQQCRCTGKQLRSFRCLTRESGHRVWQRPMRILHPECVYGTPEPASGRPWMGM